MAEERFIPNSEIEMERVENNEIREIAKRIYAGSDFDSLMKTTPKNFTRASFVTKVVNELKRNLSEKNADRVFKDKNINRKVSNVLGGKSKKDYIEVEYTIKSNKRPRNDPIIEYDSDVSSECGTTGERTLDSSTLMDSMETSILDVSTRSTSGRVEQLEAKVHALEAANKALEARATAAEDECRLWQGKSRDLFKVLHRSTRANGSGKCEAFDSRLDAIVLDAENRGVAAKHVREVCQAFVDVLGWFNEDDQFYRKVFIMIRTV